MDGTTTLGTASLIIRPANANRQKLIITNLSDTRVFICQGPAVVNTGIALMPNGSFVDEPDTQGFIYKGAWSGISSAATKAIAWLEYSTA